MNSNCIRHRNNDGVYQKEPSTDCRSESSFLFTWIRGDPGQRWQLLWNKPVVIRGSASHKLGTTAVEDGQKTGKMCKWTAHITHHTSHSTLWLVQALIGCSKTWIMLNPLNAELNPICYLLALLGAHHFLHVSRIRVKSLTLRLLMSYIYIYGAPILDVSRSHTTTQHSR